MISPQSRHGAASPSSTPGAGTHGTYIPTCQYEPSIDGLRAVAVGSVILFHLNAGWLPGGFVGVDIFFVLSGYLITSIIYRDCARGRFSIARFFQRRIARILPVFLLVAVLTLLAAHWLYPGDEVARSGGNFAASLISLANVKLMLQGNYFEMQADSQPFLHYWSLAVEEQFYMFFPPLFLLLYAFLPRKKLTVLLGLGLLSFIACVILTQLRPVWAFYLLPTRAFELLAGCALAVVPISGAGRSSGVIRLLPTIGLLLLGASIVFIPEGPSFPGALAAIPVLGTVAMLASTRECDSRAKRLLSLAPFVVVGQLSYSLYLWHWPVFSFVDYRMLYTSEAVRVTVKLALTAVAAVGSFYLVERPCRKWLNEARNQTWAYGALTLTLVVGVPLGYYVSEVSDHYINARESLIAQGGSCYNDDGCGGSVVLMGDSVGAMYGKMIRGIAAENDCCLNVLSMSGKDPLPFSDGRPNRFWEDSLAYIRSARPDVLVLACSWAGKLKEDPDRAALAVHEIQPYVGHIILVTQPPVRPDDASRTSLRRGRRGPFREDPAQAAARIFSNARIQGLASERVSVMDIEQHFHLEDGALRCFDDQGHELYRDSHHLSAIGIEEIRADFARALAQAVQMAPKPLPALPIRS